MDKGMYPWYRQRGYLHFDIPVGIRKASAIVSSPIQVAKHAFWPLISYQIVAEKLTKSASGTLEKNSKERPIAYAAHVDSHIYAFYSQLLSELYEQDLRSRKIDRHVLAFRSLGKSNIEFARDAFAAIRSFGPCGVVAVDISNFFGNLDHQILKQQWAKLLRGNYLPADHYNIFRSLTQFASVDRDELYQALGIAKHNPKNGRIRICSPQEFDLYIRRKGLIKSNREGIGIPQGSPISALLSNIYMLDFDQRMSEAVSEWGGHYYRYCDDMLFIVPEEFTSGIAGMVASEIKSLKLSINPKKTEIRRFSMNQLGYLKSDKPLQYLGFLFNGQSVLIRSAAFARFSERMKKGTRLAKSTCIKRNKIRLRNGQKVSSVYKRKLYERYSHLGKRNFIRYGLRAAEIMDSKSIRRQLKPLWNNLQEEINRPLRKAK